MYRLEKVRYTLTELENMLPWERDINVSLILNDIKEEVERKRNANRQ